MFPDHEMLLILCVAIMSGIAFYAFASHKLTL